LQGNGLVRSLGLELEKGNRIAVDAELPIPEHPEVFAVGDIAAITDQKTSQVLPQLGSVALQSGEHAGETIARRVAGKQTKAFQVPRQRNDGDDRTGLSGRADAGRANDERERPPSSPGERCTSRCCRRNEDRAKAVVDWAGAGLTHQRGARITVES
jgi:NADPH-dependent 2,4-dienoyl-CoA reductase/sulfur reductase-like enzyme